MNCTKKILGLIAIVGLALPAEAATAVIANKGVDLGTVDAARMADVYALEVGMSRNGAKLVLFDASTPSRDHFYGWLGETLVAYKKIWMKKQLAGEGKAPALVSSDAEVLAKVASTPGGIGYVDASAVNGTVKVLVTIP